MGKRINKNKNRKNFVKSFDFALIDCSHPLKEKEETEPNQQRNT